MKRKNLPPYRKFKKLAVDSLCKGSLQKNEQKKGLPVGDSKLLATHLNVLSIIFFKCFFPFVKHALLEDKEGGEDRDCLFLLLHSLDIPCVSFLSFYFLFFILFFIFLFIIIIIIIFFLPKMIFNFSISEQ